MRRELFGTASHVRGTNSCLAKPLPPDATLKITRSAYQTHRQKLSILRDTTEHFIHVYFELFLLQELFTAITIIQA